MEANKILTADVLDIIFEGRNKEYGAYELRKTYNKRLVAAIVSMVALFVLLMVGYFIAGTIKSSDSEKAVVVQEVQLEDIPLHHLHRHPHRKWRWQSSLLPRS